jgi:hypothetical protein
METQDPIGLMVRSVAKQRVSNHGAAPSFETGASHPPQDEAENGIDANKE